MVKTRRALRAGLIAGWIVSGWPGWPVSGGGAAAEEPGSIEEDRFRDLIAVYVKDIEAAAASVTADGLKVTAGYLPDAHGYHVAREYLARREEGDEHGVAVRNVALSLAKGKRREGMAGVLLRVENLAPGASPAAAARGAPRRIYTLQKELLGTSLFLAGPDAKKLSARLAGPPRNLRSAQIRVKKFWVVADGRTNRGAYDADDPASIGRKPLVSKPSPALLIEEKPVEAELLLKAVKGPLPRLNLRELQRYEGPFVDDHLDLNGGRRWDPVQPIEVELQAPAGGLEPPPAMLQLLKDVRATKG